MFKTQQMFKSYFTVKNTSTQIKWDYKVLFFNKKKVTLNQRCGAWHYYLA